LELKKEKIEYKLTGKMLKIYLYMLKKGENIGITEIQRALGFKSPSHVSYYLDKLIELGLVRKDERGSYSLIKDVKIGVLSQFIRVGKLMLPRYLFYASFVTSMLITYIIRFFNSLDPFVLLFGFISSGILWFEAIRLWLEKPF